MSEAAKEERASRKLKATEGKNEALLETNKPSNKTETPVAEPEFNIEEIYEGAIERTAEKESQMRNSAVEYIHPFTPNNI